MTIDGGLGGGWCPHCYTFVKYAPGIAPVGLATHDARGVTCLGSGSYGFGTVPFGVPPCDRPDTAPRYVVVPLADADEAERLREALRFLCRADVERCWFCGATATKRSPSTSWWCDVCAPSDAVDHEHAATLRPLLPPRGGAK